MRRELVFALCVGILSGCASYHGVSASGGTADVVWHEALHAYWLKNPKSKRRWMKLVKKQGFEYSDAYHTASEFEFPKKGVMSWYGATDPEEDGCEWYGQLGEAVVHGTRSFNARKFRQIHCDEELYIEKLKFFLEEGLITQETYEALKTMILLP